MSATALAIVWIVSLCVFLALHVYCLVPSGEFSMLIFYDEYERLEKRADHHQSESWMWCDDFGDQLIISKKKPSLVPQDCNTDSACLIVHSLAIYLQIFDVKNADFVPTHDFNSISAN